MSIMITIRDESAYGHVHHELPLELPTETLTVRELLRERVYQEVQDHNLKQDELTFRGLVQPSETEKIVNGLQTEYKLKKKRVIDWKQQYEIATDAFSRHGVFILIDNLQVVSLDQQLQITPSTTVSFIKLTPLVGG